MIIFTDFKNAQMSEGEVLAKCFTLYHPQAIYLREKGLSDNDYLSLARQIKPVCDKIGVDFFVCNKVKIAKLLGVKNLHINIKELSKIDTKNDFDNISVSVHSVEEAKLAKEQGATMLVYGHIFVTACKQGLPPRGLEKLKEICDATTLPVIAIGGIKSTNYVSVLQSGAQDFAIMSSAMNFTF